MKKKAIAIVLAVIIAFSTSVTAIASTAPLPEVNEFVSAIKGDVNSFHSSVKKLKGLSGELQKEMVPYLQDVVLTTDNVESALKIGSEVMIQLIEKIKEKPEPTEPTEPPSTTTPSFGEKVQMTVKELQELLSKYIFINQDQIDEKTQEILNKELDENGEPVGVKYYEVTLSDGTKTVYIAVNIKEHPEVFNLAVFRETVRRLAEEQGQSILPDDGSNDDYLMTYEHIAGELALHAVLYAASNKLINSGHKNSIILKLWESCRIADLNIDEARLPSALIKMFGVIVMDMFTFNVVKIFMSKSTH